MDELLARFPEVPRDLRDEPILAEYVKAFGPLLRMAQKPSPCMGSSGDAQHVFYTCLLTTWRSTRSAWRRVTGPSCGFRPRSPSTASNPPRSPAPSCPAVLLAHRESPAAEGAGARAPPSQLPAVSRRRSKTSISFFVWKSSMLSDDLLPLCATVACA